MYILRSWILNFLDYAYYIREWILIRFFLDKDFRYLLANQKAIQLNLIFVALFSQITQHHFELKKKITLLRYILLIN